MSITYKIKFMSILSFSFVFMVEAVWTLEVDFIVFDMSLESGMAR